MGKLMPVLFLSGMSVMALISWQNVADFNKEIDNEYNGHISRAEEYESKEIYVDAVYEYKKAFEMRPDYDMALHISELYDKLGESTDSYNALEEARKLEPSNPETYNRLIDYYGDNSNDSKLYSIIMLAKENNAATDEMEKMLKDLLNHYDTRDLDYEEFMTWHYPSDETVGYAVVAKDGLYGIIDSEFNDKFACDFDYIGLIGNSVLPTCDEGEYYYMDSSCNKKLVPDRPAEYLGSFSENYAPAKIGGKYGYLDSKMNEYSFDYDYAGGFLNGMAAVRKGDKWAVINSSFVEITEYVFDEIVMDPYHYCSVGGVFFGKKGDKYYLYNSAGEEISQAFDEVKLFASDAPAAVRIGKKWGYVDVNGTVVIEPKYEDAASFNLDFAPVKLDGKWYFMTPEEEKMVDLDFDKVAALSDNGYALAEKGDKKMFVKIRKYE